MNDLIDFLEAMPNVSLWEAVLALCVVSAVSALTQKIDFRDTFAKRRDLVELMRAMTELPDSKSTAERKDGILNALYNELENAVLGPRRRLGFLRDVTFLFPIVAICVISIMFTLLGDVLDGGGLEDWGSLATPLLKIILICFGFDLFLHGIKWVFITISLFFLQFYQVKRYPKMTDAHDEKLEGIVQSVMEIEKQVSALGGARDSCMGNDTEDKLKACSIDLELQRVKLEQESRLLRKHRVLLSGYVEQIWSGSTKCIAPGYLEMLVACNARLQGLCHKSEMAQPYIEKVEQDVEDCRMRFCN